MADPGFPRDRSFLQARSPFAALATQDSADAGVAFSVQEDLALAIMHVRKGQRAAFTQRVWEQFQIDLPQGPRRAAAGDIALVGIAPGAWLATQERSSDDFAESLARAMGHVTSVTDQSDGYTVLRVSGPKVRDVFCKVIPVDLHARAFGVGQVAVTATATIGVILWRLEDAAWHDKPCAVFEMAVPRTLTKSFWRAL